MKLGIIGLGAVGKKHMKKILMGEWKTMELVAIADLNAERQKESLALLKENVIGFSQGANLVRHSEIEGVLLALPPHALPALATLAFANRKHVFLDSFSGLDEIMLQHLKEKATKAKVQLCECT